ncbi:ribosome assembly protein METTL17, mitochondrial isoform X1 [Mobula birostris]|uniref:ribosome assembly protein METTL17, mitochondrial isoform X1 n=1 Tax=Mobula birostris TaxID=1983395 RepID=UPI003B284215
MAAGVRPAVGLRSLAVLSRRLCPGEVLIALGHQHRPSSSASATPHRRHPGISALGTLRLPEALRQAAQLRLHANPINCLEENARDLTNFLWSRQRAVEDVELRARARGLAKKFQEDTECDEIDQDSRELQAGEEERQERLRHQVLAELRRTIPRWKAVSYDARLSHVYLAARLDGGYAAVTRVLHEIKKRVPEFEPSTLLDFGSGTGTVAWAGRRAWGASLREIVCVDTSPPMHQLADFLMRGGSDVETEHSRGVYFRHFLPVSPKVKFDLVVSAYSLSELPTCADRCRVLETLWRKTQGFLVLIENGTRDGHQILMEARNLVLTADVEPFGHVFAPCSHDLACPKLAGSVPQPCNFSQAYHPLPFSWNPGVKQELFSYLVLRRGARVEGEDWPRVIRPVLCRPRHVHTHLCCPDGTLQHLVLTSCKSGRDRYRWARNCSWGDRLPTPSSEVTAADGSQIASGVSGTEP